jgi:hypothetical protein
MTATKSGSRELGISAAVALVFGVLTVFAGGAALFGGDKTSELVGNAVPFVLWFNFLAGFAYLAAGGGLLLRRRWAVWLSLAILVGTVVVALFFGIYILRGGIFEMRTVGALFFRAGVWGAITIAAARAIRP